MESKKLNHPWRKVERTNTAEQEGSGLLSRIQPSIGAVGYANHNNHRKWGRPPPDSKCKLNFNVAIFSNLGCSGMVVIIRNEKGEVMGAMSTRRLWVNDSLEVEALACRRALQFAVGIGLSYLIIEGDSVQVMNAIRSRKANLSWLGHIFKDIQVLGRGRMGESKSEFGCS